MPDAMQTVHTLRRASAQVAVRQTALLCIKGSLAPHEVALERWWGWLRGTGAGRRLAFWQGGHSPAWRSLSDESGSDELKSYWPPSRGPALPRWLRFASNKEPTGDDASTALLIQDLPDVRGVERASLIHLALPDRTLPATLLEIGDASMERLPLWWGTAGFAFEAVSGRPDVVARRVAALARRYWCAQLHDLTDLQWRALDGMPGIGWLHWIGADFAARCGTSVESLADDASRRPTLMGKRASQGLSLAAGPLPIMGDTNIGEDVGACVDAAHVLKPLLLEALAPMAGLLARAEVIDAWLHRFERPEVWAATDLDA